MIGFETWSAITALLAKAANSVDCGDLETWLDCFDEQSRYHILSRENFERKLPLTLFQCDNKNMMRDRVLSLREANVVNIHRDQHVTSLPQIEAAGDDTFSVTTGYAVYQTNQEGFSNLFSVGAVQGASSHRRYVRDSEHAVHADLSTLGRKVPGAGQSVSGR
jgi:anthranilate 1,2-dioxygenase small subunit